MNIFATATLCDTSCTIDDFVSPALNPCEGKVTATKRGKILFFHCNTPAASFATVNTIEQLITNNKARVINVDSLEIPEATAIKQQIDPKKPESTVGYNQNITARDTKWYPTFQNIDLYNEIQADIENLHIAIIDQDDELRLYRTSIGAEFADDRKSGETDIKQIMIKLFVKWYLSDTQPALNKPTRLAGLYASL